MTVADNNRTNYHRYTLDFTGNWYYRTTVRRKTKRWDAYNLLLNIGIIGHKIGTYLATVGFNAIFRWPSSPPSP
jgi:hypothetical protein